MTFFRVVPIMLMPVLLFSPLKYSGAQEAKIEGGQREIAADMLTDIYKDVKSDYYESKYHGVDIEERYKQAGDLIRKATSFNQALGAIAWYLDPLNDSHTFFVPPSRPFHLDYGWRMKMVGSQCLITAVKPGTDAEKKGLHPGDEILMINNVPPDRDNLWKLQYLYNVLRPQPGLHVVLQSPQGDQRTLDIAAEVVRSQQLITLDNFWKEIIDAEKELQQFERHSHAIGKDVLIWKLPGYNMNEKGVDALIGQASGYKNLVLDLRDNPGGRLDSLGRMIQNVFDHDVKIGVIESRKKAEQLVAKTRGNAFGGKLIVIIDSQSASAAELFARIVQLEKRGTIIGDRSAGAVMVSEQRPHTIGLDRQVFFGDSITVGNIVMTDGRSLEHTGVTPDEIVLPKPEDMAAGRDPVLSRAVALAGAELSPEEAGKLFPVKWIKYR